MSYSPAKTGVPNGIVYFGTPASDNVFEAESNFTYNASTDTLYVDNIVASGDVSVTSGVSVGTNLTVDGNGSFGGNLTVLGNVNVSGAINQISLQELLIEDNKIVLNSSLTGAPNDDIDGEIIVNRGTSPDVKIIYNEGVNKDIWEFTNDGSIYHPFFIAGSGISSDGKLDICDLPVVTDGSDLDYIAICDASDSNITKKITRANLFSGLGAMSQWYLEDEDGTETTIQNNTEVKFVGSGITINWDAGDGSDSTPYRLEFDVNVDNSTLEIDSGTDNLRLKAGGITFSHLSDALVIASGEAFSDSDTALMTAAAIADKIESYGYSTSTGTITQVIGGSGLSPDSGNTSGSVTLDVNVDDSTVGINGSDAVYVKNGGIGTTQLADGAVTEVKVTRTITEVSVNSTVSHDVTLVNTAGSDKTITLPTATNGRVVIIKKKDNAAGNVVVVGAAHDSTNDTIDGASSKRLYYIYESMTLIAKTTGTSTDTQAWYII